MGNTKPGTKSTVTVFRRGGSRDLNVTIAEIEPEKPAQARGRARRASPSRSHRPRQVAGLAVSDLTDAQKKELKLKGGVKVDAATEAAARAGLREGDVILAIGNIEVANVKEFDGALAKADKTKPVSVLFRRGDWAQYAADPARTLIRRRASSGPTPQSGLGLFLRRCRKQTSRAKNISRRLERVDLCCAHTNLSDGLTDAFW